MASFDDECDLFAIDIDIPSPASSPKLPRDYQSEEAFLEVKKTWKPKVETGNIGGSIRLKSKGTTKQDSQAIMHAIEELYFEKEYGKAAGLARCVLSSGSEGEIRSVIEKYLERCEEMLRRRQVVDEALKSDFGNQGF
ncbi:hypothetical protein BJ878DRAFT_512641 [Calycina marina]|uniref:Uncharacterized protein n=1 Tax=Calycina marina TaxID=1763456 RepID=A0A9P8CDV8_9HELO|nr:hypothetical protein BJ878DRAFT_512641 [Calycina marina]